MPALWMAAVIAEGLSDDLAFEAARQSADGGPLLLGRDRYVHLDKNVLFPNDRLAYTRAEDVFGVQPQFGQSSIAGLGMNTCWAVRIRPLVEGRRRLLFFGLVNFRCEMVTVGPPNKGDGIYLSLI